MRRADRIVIVGSGAIGLRHALAIRSLDPQQKIINISRRKSATKRFDQSSVYDLVLNDFHDLDVRSVKAAIICSPASLHIIDSKFFLKHGIYTLIEKPLSSEVPGALCAKDLASEIRLVGVAYNLRFAQVLLKARDILARGAIGTLVKLDVYTSQYLPEWRPQTPVESTVSANKALGGGVLNELSHEIDLVHWLIGEVVSVSGWCETLSDLKIDVEDTAVFRAKIKSRCGDYLSANVNLSFGQVLTKRELIIVGTLGVITVNLLTNQISVVTREGLSEVQTCQSAITDSYNAQWESFLSAVDHGQENWKGATFDDAYHVLEVIQAVRSSSSNDGCEALVRSSE